VPIIISNNLLGLHFSYDNELLSLVEKPLREIITQFDHLVYLQKQCPQKQDN